MAADSVKLAVEIDLNNGNPRVASATPLDPPEEPEPSFGGFHLAKQKKHDGEDYLVVVHDGGTYPLPQSPKKQPDSEFNETIGPHQVEGNRLWFGVTFYDGEGWTGTGGFGYFDASTAS